MNNPFAILLLPHHRDSRRVTRWLLLLLSVALFAAVFDSEIEVSIDGTTFTTVLEQSTNAIVRNTIFEEIPPARCRFVRLAMINWPRTTPLGIIEFTLFGKPAGSLPASQPISYEA
jgi:hypothetical protein